MENPKLDKLKESLRRELRNPQFHLLNLNDRLARINFYINQGLSQAVVAQIISEAQAELQQTNEVPKEQIREALSNYLNNPANDQDPDKLANLNNARLKLGLPISNFNLLIRDLWKRNTDRIVQLREVAGQPGLFYAPFALSQAPLPRNPFPQVPNPFQGRPINPELIVAEISEIINKPESPNYGNAPRLLELRNMLSLGETAFNELLNRLYLGPEFIFLDVLSGNPFIRIDRNEEPKPNQQQNRIKIRESLSNWLNSVQNIRDRAEILERYRRILGGLSYDDFNLMLSKLWRNRGYPPRLFSSIKRNILRVIFVTPKLTNVQIASLLDNPPRTFREVQQRLNLAPSDAEVLVDELGIRFPIQPLEPIQPQVRQPEIQQPQRQRAAGEIINSIDPTTLMMVIPRITNLNLNRNPERAQIFNEGRNVLGLNVDDFNTLLTAFWGNGRAPELIINSDGTPRLIIRRQPDLRESNPREIPQGFVDPQEVVNELEEFIRYVVAPVAQKEMNLFGRNGIFVEDLRALVDDIDRYIVFIERQMAIRYEPVFRQDVDDALEGWTQRLQNIVTEQNALGKRCVNTETPINMTPVDELSDEEFIRLNNGVCWEIPELLDYIRAKNGRNDTSDLRNYPTRTIWENNEELDHILHLPEAERTGFSNWLRNITTGGLAAKISNETLNQLYTTASILGSNGQPFVDAVDRELRQDPRLYNIWTRVLERDFSRINGISDIKIRRELETAVAVALKSTAMAEFHRYYHSLSDDERNALNTFNPDLPRAIDSCYGGRECVFAMSDILITLRNEIARIKKLPIIQINPLRV